MCEKSDRNILQTYGVLTQEYCISANINLNEMEYGGRSLGSISTTYQLKILHRQFI